jgi:hypothetical protein
VYQKKETLILITRGMLVLAKGQTSCSLSAAELGPMENGHNLLHGMHFLTSFFPMELIESSCVIING